MSNQYIKTTAKCMQDCAFNKHLPSTGSLKNYIHGQQDSNTEKIRSWLDRKKNDNNYILNQFALRKI